MYDADRTFGGKVCKMWEHVERLYRSLKYLRIDIGIAKEELYKIVLKVIDLNIPLLGQDEDYLARIQVSRGKITLANLEISLSKPQDNTGEVTTRFCTALEYLI